jgi:uroporphyrinogen-III synthase
MSGALAGRAVLVTRPAGLSARLVALLGAEGGEPVLLPAIEILAPDDAAKLEAAIDRLEGFDIAIFISPTAVAKADAAVRARRDWPAQLKYVAVGS